MRGPMLDADSLAVALTLCILIYGLWCQAYAAGAKLDDCTKNENTALSFLEGEPIEICCHLSEEECSSREASNFDLELYLWKSKYYNMSEFNQLRPEDCTKKLEVDKSAKKSSHNKITVICKKNGTVLTSNRIQVVERIAEDAVGNLSFICTEHRDLTVKFDAYPNYNYNDNYSVVMIENENRKDKENVSLCKNESLVCTNLDGKKWQCTCSYKETRDEDDKLEYLSPPDEYVTIVVQVNRTGRFSLEKKKKFNFLDYIQPQEVGKPAVTPISSKEANVTLKLPHLVDRLIPLGSNLQVRVVLQKTCGIPDTLMFLADASTCKAFRLQNLTESSSYTLSVSGIGGGGEGKSSTAEFRTMQSVPPQPPHVDKWGYTTVTTAPEGHQSLLLLWEPLPHQGCSELSYSVNITSPSGFHRSIPHLTTTYAVVSDKLPSDKLSARVWAEAEGVLSSTYSEIDILSVPDSVRLETHVNFTNGRARVYINSSDMEMLTSIGVHWCSRLKQDGTGQADFCESYTNVAVMNLTGIRRGESLKYDFEFSTDYAYECIHENITVECNHDRNIMIKGSKASLKHILRRPSRVVCDNSTYEAQCRLVRDSIKSKMDEAVCKDLKGKLENKTPSVERHHRVLFSVQSNGLWSGMIPTSCYYDQSSDNITLILSQEFAADGSQVFIRWKQDCNSEKPLQFLPDRFRVFASKDESCNEDAEVVEVQNKIFQPHVVKLPKDTLFACVEAYREGQFIKKFVKPIDKSRGVSTNSSFVIPVVVTVLAFFALGAIVSVFCLLRFCKRRRRHFYGLRDTEEAFMESAPLGHEMNGSADVHAGTPPELPMRSTRNASKGSTISLTDAGLGSSCTGSSGDNTSDTPNQNTDKTGPSSSINNAQSESVGETGNRHHKGQLAHNSKTSSKDGVPVRDDYVKMTEVNNNPERDKGYIPLNELLGIINKGVKADQTQSITDGESTLSEAIGSGGMTSGDGIDIDVSDDRVNSNATGFISLENKSNDSSAAQNSVLAPWGLTFTSLGDESSSEESEKDADEGSGFVNAEESEGKSLGEPNSNDASERSMLSF